MSSTWWTWNAVTQEWENRKPKREKAEGNYFTPRTYHNMADHPVHVSSPGELKEALRKYDCYERG